MDSSTTRTQVLEKLEKEALKALLPRIRAGSYWKQSGPNGSWERYLYFKDSPVGTNTYSVSNCTGSVFVPFKGGKISRYLPNMSMGFCVGPSFTWTETTRDRMEFWWHLARQ